MNLGDVFVNEVLIGALVAWGLAQAIKVPLDFLRTGKLNWALLLSTGGMPSTHSALVSACAHGIGLWYGFNSPIFALGAVVAMIVIYDATGIRRQAGRHAELINAIVSDLTSGHPIQEKYDEKLKEVLGHTPLEALGGLVWGLLISTLVWMAWG